MHYVTPFTYWIGGVLTSVLRGMPVTCEESELTIFESPSNMTCGEYASSWLEEHGVGYLSNPDSYGNCGYCKYTSGDDVSSSSISTYPYTIILCINVTNGPQYLSGIELDSSKIWPYFGIFLAFVISNYLMVYLLVYLRSVVVWKRR